MKIKKELILTVLVGLVILSSVPRTIQGIEIFSTTGASLVQASNEEYLVIFKYDYISNDQVYDEVIKARTCRETPTEFQTIDVNDVIVTSYEFEYDECEYRINHTELVFLSNNAFLFLAAENMTSSYSNLTFFAITSADNGVTWTDHTLLSNTSINIINFNWFDATKIGTDILVAYAYREGVNKTKVFTTTQFLGTSDHTQTNDHYGDDFELYTYDNTVYLVSTNPNGYSQVRFTQVSTDYLDLGVTVNIDAPVNNATYFNPSVTYWDEGFFIAAHDMMDDVYDAEQNITLSEYYLWGAKIDDLLDTDPTYYPVVKEDADGYYRMNPSVSVYKDELFVAFEVGQGKRFGGGWPTIFFGFSKDGETWTNDYMGHFNLFLNPGIYFAIATVGCFVIALPSYYFYTKFKKGK